MPQLYQATLKTAFQGITCLNLFNYVTDSTPAVVSGSFALAFGLGAVDLDPNVPGFTSPAGSLIDALRDALSEQVRFVDLTVINVYDEVDFYQATFPVDALGRRGGQALPPTIAVGYRSNQVRRGIRRGQKRFSGIAESDLTDGQFLGTDMTDPVNIMNNPIVYDDDGTSIQFRMCIVGKEKYVPDPDKPTKTAYRYRSEATQFDYLATNVLWQRDPYARTQVSRQRGRGI